MRKIKVFISDKIISLEIDKKVFEVTIKDFLSDDKALELLGFSAITVKSLHKSILTALDKNLDNFTIKF